METNHSLAFESVLDRFQGRGGMHYLDVPDEIARQFTSKGSVRVICTLNDEVEYQCALLPRSEGPYFVYVGRQIQKKARLALGQRVRVSLKKHEGKYGIDMPEELQELLDLDDEANRIFHELLPGKQRGIIYYIASAKSIDTRINRAIQQMDKLKIAQQKKINGN